MRLTPSAGMHTCMGALSVLCAQGHQHMQAVRGQGLGVWAWLMHAVAMHICMHGAKPALCTAACG